MNSNPGKTIQRLLDEKIGDTHRLDDMQTRIGMGKELYNSDVMYLEKLLLQIKETPVVFGEEPFVYEKKSKTEIVTDSVKHTVKQTVKKTIPLKLIIVSALIIILSGLVFLAYFLNAEFLPGVLEAEFFNHNYSDIFKLLCEIEIPFLCDIIE